MAKSPIIIIIIIISIIIVFLHGLDVTTSLGHSRWFFKAPRMSYIVYTRIYIYMCINVYVHL